NRVGGSAVARAETRKPASVRRRARGPRRGRARITSGDLLRRRRRRRVLRELVGELRELLADLVDVLDVLLRLVLVRRLAGLADELIEVVLGLLIDLHALAQRGDLVGQVDLVRAEVLVEHAEVEVGL